MVEKIAYIIASSTGQKWTTGELMSMWSSTTEDLVDKNGNILTKMTENCSDYKEKTESS